jgi:hypothetical protein
MMQDSHRHYAGCAIELYEGGAHLQSRELSEAFLTWLIGVATWQRDRQQREIAPRYLDVAFAEIDGTWMPVQDRLTKEAPVSPAVFQPELIVLMKLVLDDVTAILPEAKRTSTMKVEIASSILACAARGDHNPAALKAAALLGTVSVN